MPVLGLLVITVLTVNVVSGLGVTEDTTHAQCTSESIIPKRVLQGGIFRAFQWSQWSGNSVNLSLEATCSVLWVREQTQARSLP